MTFWQRIKELRSSLGISLKSLSARLKIDRDYLSRVEDCKKLFNPQDGPANSANATCPHCSERFSIAKAVKMSGEPLLHRMYAKLVLKSGETKDYQTIDIFDKDLYSKASKE